MQQVAGKYHQTGQRMTEEMAIIERCQRDVRHFEVLYNRYYEDIFRFIYQRMNDKEGAYDITSQVFLKALTNIGKYTFKGVPFSAWLFRIARNELYEQFRSKSTERYVNVDKVGLSDLLKDTDEDKEEKYELMMDVISKLDEDDLQLIEMKYFEKRQFSEIADILGISESNAKVKAHRIIEKLRKTIKEKYYK